MPCQVPMRSSSACSTANVGGRVLQGWQVDKGSRGKANQVEPAGGRRRKAWATEGARRQMTSRVAQRAWGLTANVEVVESATGLASGQGRPREGASDWAQGVGRTIVCGCPHGGEATEGVQREMHKAEQLILLDGECGGRVLQGWQIVAQLARLRMWERGGGLQGWRMDRGSCRKVNGVERNGREG